MGSSGLVAAEIRGCSPTEPTGDNPPAAGLPLFLVLRFNVPIKT